MSQQTSQPTVAIAGGGLAGLAAACALSDAGFHVTVIERRPFLGGRASSYEHPGTGEVVDNCQHVLFRCCTNLIEFYQRIGVEKEIRWYDEMTFIEPGGRQSSMKGSSWPAPLHTMPSFLHFPFLDAGDKIAIARAMVPLMLTHPSDNGRSFAEWLVRHGQTKNAVERFWKPILISALSEDLDKIAVPYAAQVVRVSMQSPESRHMGVPTVPLTTLYNAAGDYVQARGGRLLFRTSLDAFAGQEDKVRVQLSARDGGNGSGFKEQVFDSLVLALPFDGVARVLPDVDEAKILRGMLAHFETSPITGIHLWFDRQISDLDHAVLLDRTIQWMFHKSRLQPIRTQGDFTGSYIELVVSSSKTLIEKSRSEIVDLALAEVREFFPAAREASLVKSTVVKEVHATYSPRPGIDAYRPGAATEWPQLFLAGDWTNTGWPATMEGAVRSGYLAAEALLQASGTKKNLLVADLPPAGLMRWFG